MTEAEPTFEVKRVVVEMYQVKALTKKEALEKVGIQGGPYSVIIKSERVKKIV